MRAVEQDQQRVKQQGDDSTEHTTSYPIETVLENGDIQLDAIACYGAFTVGSSSGKQALYNYLSSKWVPPTSSRHVIAGVGVTEAGLARADTPAMHELYGLLAQLFKKLRHNKQPYRLS